MSSPERITLLANVLCEPWKNPRISAGYAESFSVERSRYHNARDHQEALLKLLLLMLPNTDQMTADQSEAEHVALRLLLQSRRHSGADGCKAAERIRIANVEGDRLRLTTNADASQIRASSHMKSVVNRLKCE
ncbi:MAG: hypothetical protein ACWGQW_03165 [bacterium]